VIHQGENAAHHLLRFHFYRSSSASKFQAVTRDSVTQRERDEGRRRRGVPVPRAKSRHDTDQSPEPGPGRGPSTCFEENHARRVSDCHRRWRALPWKNLNCICTNLSLRQLAAVRFCRLQSKRLAAVADEQSRRGVRRVHPRVSFPSRPVAKRGRLRLLNILSQPGVVKSAYHNLHDRALSGS
jgi:hypothetical protein